MFRNVPACSGMFHVPGFIDALSNVIILHYLRLLIVMLHLSLSLSHLGLWYLGLVKIFGSQGGKDGKLKENGVDLEVSVICLNLK